jgi:arylsulfatase A-like enzyme
MNKNLIFIFMAGAALLLGGEAWGKNPNIVLLFVDDLGHADVGYNGCTDIPTPYIDSIAKNGVIFKQGYVTAPVCAPSRAGLLTGRYQNRFGYEDTPGPFRKSTDVEIGIPLSEKTMAEYLKQLGYATGIVGKWHEGRLPQYQPHRRGFDETFYFTDGWTHYFRQDDPLQRIKRGDEPVDLQGEYTTEAFGNEAVDFIGRNKDHPFFLYVPFSAPHVPLEAPTELLEKFSSIEDEGRRLLAAMVYSLDLNIGKILQCLKKHGLEENTIIIFTSDNGGKPGIPGKLGKGGGAPNFSINTPLKGIKGQLYEGGIRVPFCIQWKKQLPANKVYKHPITTLDILPTLLAATGNEPSTDDNFDGVNLLPYLTGKISTPPHDTLYWRFLFRHAIRSNGWKLVKPKVGKPELYKIDDDPNETNNLIKDYPEIAERLQEQFDEWAKEMKAPQWGWQPAISGKIKIGKDNPNRDW